MLSGETASGKYPVEAVRTMCRIAKEAESSVDTSLDLNLEKVTKPIAAVLARSIVAATTEIPLKAIIFDTWTGRTGRYLAEFRPKVPIYAMCYNSYTMRELNLTYDIYAYKFDVQKSKEDMVEKSISILLEDGRIGHFHLELEFLQVHSFRIQLLFLPIWLNMHERLQLSLTLQLFLFL